MAIAPSVCVEAQAEKVRESPAVAGEAQASPLGVALRESESGNDGDGDGAANVTQPLFTLGEPSSLSPCSSLVVYPVSSSTATCGVR